jgi:cell division protein FtsN
MTPDYRSLSPARQRGNTLTGIIIGLIIGLVIAVIVALAITKGATPFTDKSGRLGKMGEPTMDQASDPNKPLYGDKQAAREANKQFTEKPKEPEADPLAQVIAGFQSDTPAAPPAAPAASPAEAAEDKVVYYLQAGAFREMADAENTRAKLALLGFEAAVSDVTNNSGVLHRVRVGPYNQVENMNKARAKLLDSGIDVAIVRNQK